MSQLRRRYIAAIATQLSAATAAGALGTACSERERWPEDLARAEGRPRPRPAARSTSDGCREGDFCLPVPDAGVGAPALAPYRDCSASPALPNDQARELTDESRSTVLIRFDPTHTAARRTAGDSSCCYRWFEHCLGRALIAGDKMLVTEVCDRADWVDDGAAMLASDLAKSFDAGERRAQTARYARMAASEHAAIASFLVASLELMDLGAPPSLLDAHRAAAEDEIRHARIAYGLASGFGARMVGPGRSQVGPRPASATFAQAIRSTYLAGCIAETLGAESVREKARSNDRLAPILHAIADDEERHAELAWRTAAWLLVEGGVDAAASLISAAHLARSSASPSRASPRRAFAQLVLPCTAVLLAQARRTSAQPMPAARI